MKSVVSHQGRQSHYRHGKAYNSTMEEGSEVSCEGSAVNYGVDDHQVLDNKPVRLRHFYFVKVFPLENPNADARIKVAEEVIQQMNRDQITISQELRERMMDREHVNSKLRAMKYYDSCGITLKWHRERLNFLHQSLDKLTFANNAYKGKPIHSCLSLGEVDEQKLSFLMVHGCKTIVDEKKLLREVNASKRKDGGMTNEELNAPIEHLEKQMHGGCWGYRRTDIDVAREKAILKEIKQHKIDIEKAVANAAVNGKLWNSLGSKKAIQEEILSKKSGDLMDRQKKVRATVRKAEKELEKVEKDIKSLQRRLRDTNCKKNEAYNTILELKKQYGEENACYYQYRSLMNTVRTLAKKKDIAAVQDLAQGQVEEFMQQWNNCYDVRMDYKKRIIPSLNHRHLGVVDGRMITNQKPDVEDHPRVIKPEALSKTRLKWLMKDAQDPSELLCP